MLYEMYQALPEEYKRVVDELIKCRKLDQAFTALTILYADHIGKVNLRKVLTEISEAIRRLAEKNRKWRELRPNVVSCRDCIHYKNDCPFRAKMEWEKCLMFEPAWD